MSMSAENLKQQWRDDKHCLKLKSGKLKLVSQSLWPKDCIYPLNYDRDFCETRRQKWNKKKMVKTYGKYFIIYSSKCQRS